MRRVSYWTDFPPRPFFPHFSLRPAHSVNIRTSCISKDHKMETNGSSRCGKWSGPIHQSIHMAHRSPYSAVTANALAPGDAHLPGMERSLWSAQAEPPTTILAHASGASPSRPTGPRWIAGSKVPGWRRGYNNVSYGLSVCICRLPHG
jgi:hypothetical protein